VKRLAPHLESLTDTWVGDYGQARRKAGESDSDRQVFLVHYERTRVPFSGYLRALSRALTGGGRGRLFVVPHEVYREDPFAYPESSLIRTGLAGIAQHLRYRWKHRPWYRELRCQKNGYWADAVFPLSRPACEVLRERSPASRFEVIPHAVLDGFEQAAAKSTLRPVGASWLWGLFGFITPANDYELVFQALASCPHQALVVIGGDRTEDRAPGLISLRRRVEEMGLEGRVSFTGYLAEDGVAPVLMAMDGFLCPFKFRSASGSLSMVLAAGKPVLAADLPLTREYRDAGARVKLLPAGSVQAWSEAMIVEESRPQDMSLASYAWSYAHAAEAYLAQIRKYRDNY